MVTNHPLCDPGYLWDEGRKLLEPKNLMPGQHNEPSPTLKQINKQIGK